MEAGTGNRGRKKPEENSPTVNELLSAISETEYPQYILDAVGKVQEWMHDMTKNPEDLMNDEDMFASFFGEEFVEETLGLEGLFERLKSIEEFADVVPNQRPSEGKPDTVIISITPSDYDNGIRAAIDYAAVFNRDKCRRVWIISDGFVFDEVARYMAHVDALAEQGIMLRYILVTPWGWVEMPLSGSTLSRYQFLWRTQESSGEKRKPIRRRRQE